MTLFFISSILCTADHLCACYVHTHTPLTSTGPTSHFLCPSILQKLPHQHNYSPTAQAKHNNLKDLRRKGLASSITDFAERTPKAPKAGGDVCLNNASGCVQMPLLLPLTHAEVTTNT